MRASRVLVALLILPTALGSTLAWADVEILPRCSPLELSPPLSSAHPVPKSARATLDSSLGTCRASSPTVGPSGAWERLPLTGEGPGGYYLPTAYDPTQHQSLVLGGLGQYYAQYSWNPVESHYLWGLASDQPAHWTPVLPNSDSPYYTGQSTVVDTRSNRLVAFSGISREDGSLGGLSELSLANPQQWSPIIAVGPPPLVRDAHSAIYDPVRARMIVFGGRQYSRVFADTWMLSLDDAPRWTRTDSVAAAPPPRYAHNAIYDPVGDRMIIFGGTASAGYYGDLWQLSLAGIPSWTPLPAGPGPSPRIYASMVYDSRRQRIVLMGGRTQDGKPLNDM
jgi:galactose oxidase-like protein